MTIQGLPTATEGFPYIVKITVLGPGSIPNAGLKDDALSIQVTFREVGSDRVYVLRSSIGARAALETWNGVAVELKDSEIFRTSVEAGKQRSILIDLASICPETGRTTLFGDLEIGTYDITVTLMGCSKPSNTMRVNVVAADPDERRFLDEIIAQGPFRLAKGVNWSKVLFRGFRIPKDKWERLSTNTREQCAFHALLFSVPCPDKPIDVDHENEVKAAHVPAFLEPDRALLLYEMKVARGERDREEESKLANEYPDLEWRLKCVKAGSGDFLWPRKAIKDAKE